MVGDRAEGIGMDDGDFVDGIVESSMRSLFPQLQADYQRELRSALSVAIRQSRGQPVATPGPERRPTPSEPAPAAPPPPTVARALGQKAQALRRAGAAQEAEAAPGGATAPSGMAPQLFPIVEGGSPQDDLEQHLPGSAIFEQHSQRNAWQASDGTVTDVSDAGVGFALPNAAVSLPSGSRAPTDTSISFSPKSSSSPRKHRKSSFSLLPEEDVEIIKRIHKSGKEKLISPEAKCNPDWVFHQKKDNATTASKKRAFDIVTSRSFDYFMGVVIIMNSLSIGVETSQTVHGDGIPASMVVIEYFFLVIYVVELSLRFHAVGVKESLSSNWVKFDTALVVSGLTSLALTMVSVGGGALEMMAGNMNMLKMLRLVRLARTVRVVIQFRTLWLLVQGLLHSLLPMLWTCMIMMMVVYVFAILGMETIVGSSDEDLSLEAQENFHSMGSSILTFMQMMALDGSAPIYRPLIEANGLLSFVFLAFYMVGPIALMSIITAIMVESSIRTANDDLEAKKTWEADRKRSMMPKLKKLLATLDADGSGDVVLEELKEAPRELQDQITHICDLPPLALEEVFRMLDVDGSGSLDIEEFVHGIIHSQQPDKPSELLLLVQMSKAILSALDGYGDNTLGCSNGTKRFRNVSAPSSSLYRMTLLGIS